MHLKMPPDHFHNPRLMAGAPRIHQTAAQNCHQLVFLTEAVRRRQRGPHAIPDHTYGSTNDEDGGDSEPSLGAPEKHESQIVWLQTTCSSSRRVCSARWIRLLIEVGGGWPLPSATSRARRSSPDRGWSDACS